MKFGLMFANVGPFAEPEPLATLARTAEAVGLESIFTVEHVLLPPDYESRYPYSSSGRMPGADDDPIPDPLLPLAYAAAVTTTLRLGTGILILPQRHPAYVAKAMATLDRLSHGRALLGVGIGWLREEFEALGIPFAERVARTEESIRAIRSLWRPEPEPFTGEFFRWPAVESRPKPVRAGGVPILVGGHVKNAARRAARLGDGYFPVGGQSPEEIAGLVAIMAEECGRIGRDPGEIEVTTFARIADPEQVRRYAEAGVSRLVMSPPGRDADGVYRGLEEFADKIISKL